MTGKEYEQFTKGFFEAFKWELKGIDASTCAELLRYQFGDIDKEAFMKILEQRIVKTGEMRMFLNEIFRFAELEADKCAEFNDAIEAWNKVDSMIVRFYSDVKNDVDIKALLKSVYSGRE